MQIQEVDFPEPLLVAQRDGNLVIFAGAGVSMPPPSNYPDFARLADDVAGGALTRLEDEPIDRFLGRVAKQGIHVHSRICAQLSNPSSQPTSLHADLLKLAPSAFMMRLVTTNFDRHFTTAAATYFADPIEIFSAPALPLGYPFHGIVYLHGCVEKAPETLIVTDSDFGRAYLTEGWARRFLQEMFSRYTVLF